MAFQMYMVAFNGDFSQAVSRDVQHHIRKHNGVTLMVMKTGIIGAFDDSMVPFVQAHPSVKLVGGVSPEPERIRGGPAAENFCGEPGETDSS